MTGQEVPVEHLGRWNAALALAAMVAVICSNACSWPASADEQMSGFVGRTAGRFILDGKPYFVAGVNNHYLTFASPREVTHVLDDAVAMGANVVRTFVQPVIGSPDGTTMPTIWKWRSGADSSNLGVHGTYMLYWDVEHGGMGINESENGLQKLDFLVAEARNRRLRLIIAFLDYWDFTGGAQQMRAWYGSKDANDFFRDDRTKRDYKELVRAILLRVNPLTGIAYRDEPAIFAWDLMNEPDDVRPTGLLHGWIAEMSGYVKSIDRNHLVTSGLANVDGRLSDIGISTIDFGVWHGYPIYYNLTVDEFDKLIGEFCDIGAANDKPVLLEEFGYARSNGDQVDAYRKWMATIERHPYCAGWLVWRLVSLQDTQRYPTDDHDQFDIHHDGSPIWAALLEGARRLISKGGKVVP
ncbi:MAG: cellulase family glycosylhydrolase [Hyphomicrobiales bacterium]